MKITALAVGATSTAHQTKPVVVLPGNIQASLNKAPVSSNFQVPANADCGIELKQSNFNLFRNNRKKLLQQQKEKFRTKYSKFTNELKQGKEETLSFDYPGLNIGMLSKTKAPDELKKDLDSDLRSVCFGDKKGRLSKVKHPVPDNEDLSSTFLYQTKHESSRKLSGFGPGNKFHF